MSLDGVREALRFGKERAPFPEQRIVFTLAENDLATHEKMLRDLCEEYPSYEEFDPIRKALGLPDHLGNPQ